uniref:Proline-rich protein 2-like n=1 Tax=Phascolarctos cinereus TaxID=38626 RepID=A0A6P5M2H8_PHACI|nr:proline-rich protein 2-like [Phascolarctos cinereus]
MHSAGPSPHPPHPPPPDAGSGGGPRGLSPRGALRSRWRGPTRAPGLPGERRPARAVSTCSASVRLSSSPTPWLTRLVARTTGPRTPAGPGRAGIRRLEPPGGAQFPGSTLLRQRLLLGAGAGRAGGAGAATGRGRRRSGRARSGREGCWGRAGGAGVQTGGRRGRAPGSATPLAVPPQTPRERSLRRPPSCFLVRSQSDYGPPPPPPISNKPWAGPRQPIPALCSPSPPRTNQSRPHRPACPNAGGSTRLPGEESADPQDPLPRSSPQLPPPGKSYVAPPHASIPLPVPHPPPPPSPALPPSHPSRETAGGTDTPHPRRLLLPEVKLGGTQQEKKQAWTPPALETPDPTFTYFHLAAKANVRSPTPPPFPPPTRHQPTTGVVRRAPGAKGGQCDSLSGATSESSSRDAVILADRVGSPDAEAEGRGEEQSRSTDSLKTWVWEQYALGPRHGREQHPKRTRSEETKPPSNLSNPPESCGIISA